MTIKRNVLCQNAYVVDDLDAGIEFWSKTMGVGPFIVLRELVFAKGEIYGKPALPEYQAAIAYSGDLMVELIRPTGPCIFKDFQEAGGTGVHHNCVLTDDFDATEAWYVARGAKRLQYQEMPDGSRLCYIDIPGKCPVVLEIAQFSEGAWGLFEALRAAGNSWDGKDPVFRL